MTDDTRIPKDASNGDEEFFRAVDEMKQQLGEARELPSEEASRRMWNRIDAATREPLRRVDRSPQERERRSVRPVVWRGIAAAVLIGAAVTLLILRSPDVTLVAAAESERIEHTLPDGSVVVLRPHSELFLVEESEQSILYRIAGEGYFSVTPREKGIFAVEAGEALVEVLGTRFNVRTWGRAPSIYLEEGRVRFAYRPSGDEVILEAGESSRLTAQGELMPPIDEMADEHLDWLDGEIVFEQQTARLVAEELEHHFGMELEILPAAAGETLSGRILLDDQQRSLRDLGQAMGGRFVETGPLRYRFESE